MVTYTINPEANYNDGTPIDWTAYENTWKFNNGTNPDVQVNSTDGYELIESVERGADDKQAVVTFKQAYPWWEGLFDSLVPPQVKDADTFMNAYLKQVHPEWGAGPFKVETSTSKAAPHPSYPTRSGGARSRSWTRSPSARWKTRHP